MKKYLGAFRRWKAWATSHQLVPVPARPHEFVLYLQYLAEETSSKSAVEEACNALSWVHSSAEITVDPFVKATLEGLQWTLAKPVTKKEPITTEMLEAMVRDTKSSGSLSDLRLATTCLLDFAGFLRFDELINLRPCDFQLQADMMSIHIVRSKTDQLHLGDRVVVTRMGSPICPVAMMEQYLAKTGTPLNNERFLFRPIQHTRKGEVLKGTGKISYSCLRELFNKKLKQLGFPAESFGLHSLRVGGGNCRNQC